MERRGGGASSKGAGAGPRPCFLPFSLPAGQFSVFGNIERLLWGGAASNLKLMFYTVLA